MKYIWVTFGVFLILLLGSMATSWFAPTLPENRLDFLPAHSSSRVLLIPTERVVTVPVTVYVKEKLKGKVDLPETVLSTPSRQVLAMKDLPPSRGGTEVLAVLDTATGRTEIFGKEKKRSLFAFENEKRIGVRYGADLLGPRGDLFGEYTFFRAGNAYLSIGSSVTNRGDAYLGASIDYRF
jgi:hypothetical protein